MLFAVSIGSTHGKPLPNEELDLDLLKEINKAVEEICNNSFCGRNVKKKLIPKELIKRYSIDNLWNSSSVRVSNFFSDNYLDLKCAYINASCNLTRHKLR